MLRSVVDPAVRELGDILEIVLGATTLASPVLGVEGHLLNEPVMRGTGQNRGWVYLNCHDGCSRGNAGLADTKQLEAVAMPCGTRHQEAPTASQNSSRLLKKSGCPTQPTTCCVASDQRTTTCCGAFRADTLFQQP